MPEKSLYDKIAADDSSFVDERLKDLEYLLVRLNDHPVLRNSDELMEFISVQYYYQLDTISSIWNKMPTFKQYFSFMPLSAIVSPEQASMLETSLEKEY